MLCANCSSHLLYEFTLKREQTNNICLYKQTVKLAPRTVQTTPVDVLKKRLATISNPENKKLVIIEGTGAYCPGMLQKNI